MSLPTTMSRGEFRAPLIATLHELGGRASVRQIRRVMESKIAPRLSEAERSLAAGGGPRWWNAVRWERYELVKEGLLRANSPRGIWELSEAGVLTARDLFDAPSPPSPPERAGRF